MASNVSVATKDGEGQTAANLVGLPGSAFESPEVEDQSPTAQSQTTSASSVQRETGDQVNRFLLCALVSESSKSIKASAEKAGQSLPMSKIVRGVLRSYILASKDKYGPLAGVELDIPGLRRLNEKVLRDEITRHSRDVVSNSERQVALAQRHEDDKRIKAVREDLQRATAPRDRLGRVVI